MRLLPVIGSVLLIGGCSASVESDRPLFAAGSDGFKPGMWAAIPIGTPCALPTNTDIFSWPDCASPVLFGAGTAIYFAPAHVMVRFELADGTPRILQADRDVIDGMVNPSGKTGPINPNRRFYAAFYPSSGAPFTAGRVQFLVCPPQVGTPVDAPRKNKEVAPAKPIAGLKQVSIGDNIRCIADTPEAVRELARRANADDASLKLVWIGNYP
jgi:hypothetical protein